MVLSVERNVMQSEYDESGIKSMIYQQNKFKQFVNLMEEHSPQEGLNLASAENVGTIKSSVTKSRNPTCDLPMILVVGQGRKICFAGDQKYDFAAGDVLVLFYPMAMETEIVEASPDKPFLSAGVAMDLGRMADVLMRIDQMHS